MSSLMLPDKHFAFDEGEFIMALGSVESRQVWQSDFRQGKTQVMKECLVTPELHENTYILSKKKTFKVVHAGC